MKIIFSDIPMKKELHAFRYNTDAGNETVYEEEVIFPVSAYLAKTLKKGEKVRVVLLGKEDPEGNSLVNAEVFRKECDSINQKIGADIEYITLMTPFVETREIHEGLLRDMIGQLVPDAELIGDITYGPKSLPIILFCLFNFAEKYFHAQIKSIVYGKVNFVDDGSGTGKTKPINPVLYDLTSLYYLNSLTNVMDYNSPEEALTALDILLSM